MEPGVDGAGAWRRFLSSATILAADKSRRVVLGWAEWLGVWSGGNKPWPETKEAAQFFALRFAELSEADRNTPRARLVIRLMNHYVDGTGTDLELSKAEVILAHTPTSAVPNVLPPPAPLRELAETAKRLKKSVPVAFSRVQRGDRALLNFHEVIYVGEIRCQATRPCSFIGTVTLRDRWDWNVWTGDRSLKGEFAVAVARATLPGTPYSIVSVPVRATWEVGDPRVTLHPD